jgi:uncharacterized protein
MLSLAFGILVGVLLGVTGGGGAIFAVPLLVYGLSLEARNAVGVSLAVVGLTAIVGCVVRWRRGQVEGPTGLLFAGAGMVGAPLGAWLSERIPDAALLIAFAGSMLVVAVRMWRKAAPSILPSAPSSLDDDQGPACRREPEGKLRWTSQCAAVLVATGLATGVLSGLFGVGGGFIIVPALVTFSSMGMQRAIGTSLLVIALVSVSGVSGHLLAGRQIPLEIAAFFAVGGVLGMFLGNSVSQRLAGPVLQKVFASAIVVVAVFVISKTLLSHGATS